MMVLGISLGSTDARVDIRPSRSFYEMNISQVRLIHLILELLTTKLTLTPCMILGDRYMFALSSWRVTIAGCLSCRDLTIADSVSAEAEAVNAMNGTSVKALSPPILANAGRKSLPL